MKKLTVLLALTLLTSQFVGCGLFRRVRDHFCRGAYCGSTAPGPIIQPPRILTPQAPQTIVAPMPPVLIPQASVMPCNPVVTCSPVCDPCSDGLAYPSSIGCNGCEGGAPFDGQVINGQVIDGGVVGGSGTRGVSDSVIPGPLN